MALDTAKPAPTPTSPPRLAPRVARPRVEAMSASVRSGKAPPRLQPQGPQPRGPILGYSKGASPHVVAHDVLSLSVR